MREWASECFKQKNDKLAERVERLQSAACQQSLRKLKEHVKVIEADREKMLQEHGTMLAEMQQSYAKERVHCEKIEKQVAELRLLTHGQTFSHRSEPYHSTTPFKSASQ